MLIIKESDSNDLKDQYQITSSLNPGYLKTKISCNSLPKYQNIINGFIIRNSDNQHKHNQYGDPK